MEPAIQHLYLTVKHVKRIMNDEYLGVKQLTEEDQNLWDNLMALERILEKRLKLG